MMFTVHDLIKPKPQKLKTIQYRNQEFKVGEQFKYATTDGDGAMWAWTHKPEFLNRPINPNKAINGVWVKPDEIIPGFNSIRLGVQPFYGRPSQTLKEI